MRLPQRTRKRNLLAFSLIELLLVVTILGALTGGLYGLYSSSTMEARKQTSKSQQKSLKTAIDYYFAKYNSYPSSLEGLTRSYLSNVPDDPLTDFIGNDWMVIGPNATSWISSRATTLPANGIFDVQSASGI